MTCIDTQKLITPFINEKLDEIQLKEFIIHIGSCTECSEELEVYYTLLTAMRQLDEDEELSSDFGFELKREIEKAQDQILGRKINILKKYVIFAVVIITVTFVISFKKGGTSLKYNEDNTLFHEVVESDFKLEDGYKSWNMNNLEEELKEFIKSN